MPRIPYKRKARLKRPLWTLIFLSGLQYLWAPAPPGRPERMSRILCMTLLQTCVFYPLTKNLYNNKDQNNKKASIISRIWAEVCRTLLWNSFMQSPSRMPSSQLTITWFVGQFWSHNFLKFYLYIYYFFFN